MRLLKHAVVHREVRELREILLDKGQLLLHRHHHILLVYQAQHNGQNTPQTVNEMLHIGQKDAGVPQELTTLYKYTGKIALGFLSERLHTIQALRLRFLTHLNIAIAWLRTRRLHTHGNQAVFLADKVQTVEHVATEGIIADDGLVGRYDNNTSVRTDMRNAIGGPRHTRRRIAGYRLRQNIIGRQLRQLLTNPMSILHLRTDINICARDETYEMVVGLLQLCTASAKKVDKLLGLLLTAARPQTAPSSTGQYDAEMFF